MGLIDMDEARRAARSFYPDAPGEWVEEVARQAARVAEMAAYDWLRARTRRRLVVRQAEPSAPAGATKRWARERMPL